MRPTPLNFVIFTIAMAAPIIAAPLSERHVTRQECQKAASDEEFLRGFRSAEYLRTTGGENRAGAPAMTDDKEILRIHFDLCLRLKGSPPETLYLAGCPKPADTNASSFPGGNLVHDSTEVGTQHEGNGASQPNARSAGSDSTNFENAAGSSAQPGSAGDCADPPVASERGGAIVPNGSGLESTPVVEVIAEVAPDGVVEDNSPSDGQRSGATRVDDPDCEEAGPIPALGSTVFGTLSPNGPSGYRGDSTGSGDAPSQQSGTIGLPLIGDKGITVEVSILGDNPLTSNGPADSQRAGEADC